MKKSVKWKNQLNRKVNQTEKLVKWKKLVKQKIQLHRKIG